MGLLSIAIGAGLITNLLLTNLSISSLNIYLVLIQTIQTFVSILIVPIAKQTIYSQVLRLQIVNMEYDLMFDITKSVVLIPTLIFSLFNLYTSIMYLTGNELVFTNFLSYLY